MGRRKQQLSIRQSTHKMLWIEPLHVVMEPLAIPVENFRISQQFTPTYNQQEVYGRMDPIATFKRTARTMNCGFVCAAHHLLDGPMGVVNNIRNINTLTQLLYPTYKELDSGPVPLAILKSPPFFRITYGNYIGSFKPTGDLLGTTSGLTGYISSFSHEIGQVAENVAFGTLSVWESEEEVTPQNEIGFRALPRNIQVSFQFVVIHDKLVGWYNNKFSPNGYGDNFPYNAGNFIGEDEGQPGGADKSPGANSGASSGTGGSQSTDGVVITETNEKTPGGPKAQTDVNDAQTDTVLNGEGETPG